MKLIKGNKREEHVVADSYRGRSATVAIRELNLRVRKLNYVYRNLDETSDADRVGAVLE
jgi:hypothetical protein